MLPVMKVQEQLGVHLCVLTHARVNPRTQPDYPVFIRLLGMLGCEVQEFDGTVSVTPFGSRHPLCIPFVR